MSAHASRAVLGAAVLVAAAGVACAGPADKRQKVFTMEATAYSIEGKQAAKTVSKEGTAAADPDLLPLGTRVRVSGPEGPIGEFVITDTGEKIQGRRIDIYFRTDADAKKFGRKQVSVEVLEWGQGPESAKEEVKEGVSPPRHP